MQMIDKEIENIKAEGVGGVIAVFIMLLLISLMLQGCFPLITGIKKYKSGETEIDFVTGFDVAATANGTDTVSNTRGISPDVKKNQ